MFWPFASVGKMYRSFASLRMTSLNRSR
jgi:hypothetical protein